MHRLCALVLFGLLLLPCHAASEFADKQAAWQRHLELDRASLFGGLEWREIGPVVQGGRVVDVEAIPGEPYGFLVAYASGGLWKTTNNGVTFEPLFDDQPRIIIGDVAIDPNDPRRIWVGTGENNSSRSSYGGWGIFLSTDGGANWSHRGLGDSDRIGRVLVDPRDSNRVWVASLGKLYTPGGERGLYRTDDGGESWQLVLDTAADDGETGVVDLVMDPNDPDTLYAAAWQRSRRAWNFVEGGAGSGVYKTTDGGASWTRLGGGLPQGAQIGRIGLAIAESRPRTLYACVDNQELLPEDQWELGDQPITPKRLRKMTKEQFLAQDPEAIEDFIRGNDLDTALDAAALIEMIESDELTLDELLTELDDANANLFNTDVKGLEVYRSDDAGATWRRTHDEPIRQVAYSYGYYFGRIHVSPADPERVYTYGVPIITSADGGKSWSGIDGRGVHVDYHDLWIDPSYPERMIAGNDGGIDVTYDGGKSWLKLDRQPVGQFYTVHVDMEEPYNVYGGLQDNGTLKGSSRSRPGLDGWRRINGGDGMYVQTDARDGATYTGFQFGFYTRIGADGSRSTVRPRDLLGEPALRYNWATPVLLSEHNADIVYFGANRLYRSLDRGETWQAISEDLTTATERGDVPYGTITTIAESERAFGLLWVGTDDGNVHVTDDGGVEWSDVGGGLPDDRWVSRVEASRVEKDRAYVALNGYRDDDLRPYLFVTEDRGKSWSSLAAGLPAEPINVVREDPVNADVLWVGTDRGVYVSLDRGANWQGLPGALPNVPVHDLVVHPRDRELVVGTHGRSIWILDALPIQDLTPELQNETVHLFPVESMTYRRGWRGRRSPWFFRAEDAPELELPFWAAEAGTARLEVLDEDEHVLRTLEMAVERGVHTFRWDLLLDEQAALEAEGRSTKREKNKPEKGSRAERPWTEAVELGWPLYATPGDYTLRVTLGEAESERSFEMKSPRKRTPRVAPEPKIRGRDDDG